jgi:hypothetical protein
MMGLADRREERDALCPGAADTAPGRPRIAALGRCRSLAVAVAAALIAGCSPIVREIVHDGLDEETRPANWEKLRAQVRALSGEVVLGALDAGATPELAAKLDAAVDRFVRTVLHAASQELDAEVSPAMARSVRATVDAALASILSDATLQRAQTATEAVTAAALAGLARGFRDQLAPAIADALDTRLGPALQRAIEDHVGPAMAATLRRDLTPALVDAVRQSATAAGEGVVDGVRGRAEPLVDRGLARMEHLLDRAEGDASSIASFVVIAALGLLAGGLVLALWLRHRTATAARAALHLVTGEIGRMAPDPAILELARRIKAAGEGTSGGAYLADHLRAHPSIKLRPPAAPTAAGG